LDLTGGAGIECLRGSVYWRPDRGCRESRGVSAAAATMVRLLETDHLDDQLAGLAWLRKQSFVQPNRIAVAGNSFGGIETVLGVARGGYCAGIDSAGGAQSWAQAPELQSLMTRAVRNAKAPIFFFQAANDFDLSPSKTLSAEMNEVSKTYKLKIYPPTETLLETATPLATLDPMSGPMTFRISEPVLRQVKTPAIFVDESSETAFAEYTRDSLRSLSAPLNAQDCSLLAHPDVPRDRPGFLIGHWEARHPKGQLHLTVMVALMPDHVLEHEDRMVVVKFHVPACLHPFFTASRTTLALSFSIRAMRSGSRSAAHSSSGRLLANSGRPRGRTQVVQSGCV